MSKEIPLEHIAVGKGNCFSMCLLFDPYLFSLIRGEFYQQKKGKMPTIIVKNIPRSQFSSENAPLIS